MESRIKVRCETSLEFEVDGFTRGKVYEATHFVKGEYVVVDDRHRCRFIVPGRSGSCGLFVRVEG